MPGNPCMMALDTLRLRSEKVKYAVIINNVNSPLANNEVLFINEVVRLPVQSHRSFKLSQIAAEF